LDVERGSGGTSLGFILLMPAVLLLIFGGIQFGMHNYARSLAVAAAQAGARAATQAPASTQRGQQAAEDFVAHQAAGTLTDAVITVTQAGGQITVTVTAAAPTLVPLAHPHVAGQASAAIDVLP
jgi:Flp pilus assembly protein TadG